MIHKAINSRLLVCTAKNILNPMEESLHVGSVNAATGLRCLSRLQTFQSINNMRRNLRTVILRDFCVESTKFSSPVFMRTDDATTMIVASDGRFHVDREVNIGRSGCVEHRLSRHCG